ncbi:UNVERIFIED_CONTAM: hypothetical protein K2H54_056972 [Gekko kuhli]
MLTGMATQTGAPKRVLTTISSEDEGGLSLQDLAAKVEAKAEKRKTGWHISRNPKLRRIPRRQAAEQECCQVEIEQQFTRNFDHYGERPDGRGWKLLPETPECSFQDNRHYGT